MRSWAFLFLATFLSCSRLYSAEVKKEGRPDVPLFSFESRVLPKLEIKDPVGFEKDASVRIENYQFRVLLPWRLKMETSSLSASLSYESMHLDYYDWDENLDPTVADQLHSVSLPLSYNRVLSNPTWSMNAFLTPSLNSDFKAVTSRALRAQGGAFWTKVAGRGAWSFGFAVINNYGTPRAFPAVAYNGKLNERQSLSVRLPVNITWNYSIIDTLDWGLASRVAGNNFRIEEEGRYKGYNVRYSVIIVGPFVKWKLTPKISAQADVGFTVHHDFAYYDGSDKKRDLDFKPSSVASFALRFGM